MEFYPASILASKTIASFVGKEMVAETAGSAYRTIGNVLTYGHGGVSFLISELDIFSRIEVAEAIIKDVSKIQHGTPSIQLCVNKVHEIIQTISKEINDIEGILDAHKKKWFHSYRIPDCTHQLVNLKVHSDIMEKRMTRLVQLIN